MRSGIKGEVEESANPDEEMIRILMGEHERALETTRRAFELARVTFELLIVENPDGTRLATIVKAVTEQAPEVGRSLAFAGVAHLLDIGVAVREAETGLLKRGSRAEVDESAIDR